MSYHYEGHICMSQDRGSFFEEHKKHSLSRSSQSSYQTLALAIELEGQIGLKSM